MKRLHVVISDDEYGDCHRVARRESLSLSEWVRRTLRAARRTVSAKRMERKLRAHRSRDALGGADSRPGADAC